MGKPIDIPATAMAAVRKILPKFHTIPPRSAYFILFQSITAKSPKKVRPSPPKLPNVRAPNRAVKINRKSNPNRKAQNSSFRCHHLLRIRPRTPTEATIDTTQNGSNIVVNKYHNLFSVVYRVFTYLFMHI